MKQFILILMLGLTAGILSSCASVMRDNKQTVNLSSNVDRANIRILNKKGNTVLEGQTPMIVTLRTASEGYFSPEKYTVEATKEGYTPLRSEIDWHVSKWYSLGNFAIGGLIGWLLIDPITGDMYYLDDEVHLNLTPINR